jgi:8-oxo-dGTP diphosphatase
VRAAPPATATSGDAIPAVVTTRIAAYAVVRDDLERVLLCRLSIDELDVGWTLPGGGIDPGEDPADAVVREVREETGLDGRVVELLGIDSRVYPPRPGRELSLHAIRVIYRMEALDGELRDELEGSTDRAEWFSRAEIESLPRVDLVDAALAMLDARPH